ncbi:MAG: phosphoenolpyruvate synthase, partial [Deltaproteobacteria bacterium]|nr:phosphoenolpyruvate synthase [Deltaproteobacteria bacterium]
MNDQISIKSLSGAGDDAAAERKAMAETLCRQFMGHEERMLALVRRYFSLEDLQSIRSRLIGSGFIGGKAVGMLLARAILKEDLDGRWDSLLDAHDSFFIGTEVFDSFVDYNGWQDIVREQRSEQGYLSCAARLREHFPEGEFPPDVRAEFRRMLEHYGQYPIIARSSSL